ncbi:pfs domain-containing protein [Ilyonectria robusta]
MDKGPAGRDAFEIAIICALPLEATAVSYLFDEIWPNQYHKAVGDPNYYVNGCIGRHNVVRVLLPDIGKAYVAAAAASLNASYINLRLALLVGICGGVPGQNKDGGEVLLGDVIISSALIQFDFGGRHPGGIFLRNLNIDSESWFAPAVCQSYVGTVLVARKDEKPLLPQHLEGVWMYCDYMVDVFGEGESTPTHLYNRQAFEECRLGSLSRETPSRRWPRPSNKATTTTARSLGSSSTPRACP